MTHRALVCIVVGFAAPARADPPDYATASRHFDAACDAFAEKRYAKALAELEASFALTHDPALLFDIAVTQESTGEIAAAARSFRGYLDALPEAPDRAEVQRRIGALATRAVIFHENAMSSFFRLVKVTYSLDGVRIFTREDETGRLADEKQIEVFRGPVAPGDHTLSVSSVYRGNAFGFFAYLKGYKLTASSSRTFKLAAGRQTELSVVGFETGNAVTTDWKDRLAVGYRVHIAGN